MNPKLLFAILGNVCLSAISSSSITGLSPPSATSAAASNSEGLVYTSTNNLALEFDSITAVKEGSSDASSINQQSAQAEGIAAAKDKAVAAREAKENGLPAEGMFDNKDVVSICHQVPGNKEVVQVDRLPKSVEESAGDSRDADGDANDQAFEVSRDNAEIVVNNKVTQASRENLMLQVTETVEENDKASDKLEFPGENDGLPHQVTEAAEKPEKSDLTIATDDTSKENECKDRGKLDWW